MTVPVFGRHEPVAQYGRRLGGVVEVRPGQWVPACLRCYRPLVARDTKQDAKDALRAHWTDKHTRKAAA